ncbi:UvrD-helicase-domain-containing protein [Flammula alnicola]|nr:UvrD-helicase-domain-containing protein [Flammula alnicola]
MGPLLESLNPAQLKAVKHDPSIPLQILAGPGSGKTKVLTSRIAQLILTHNMKPSSICAVTFTNKAANEMRDRLIKLIGQAKTTALQMGTFHSLCARYLRMHPHAVKLEANFTICDADESKKLIAALLKPYKDYMVENDITLTEGSAASVISKAKAKGQYATTFFEETEAEEKSLKRLKKTTPSTLASEEKKSVRRILAEVYIGYEQVLKDNNALDFDDLLIYGVELFTNHEESVLWCRHILVDEFQDTNTMQYELMKAIAIRRCLTIVGDPDQSIYGWRSAEVVNLSRMREDFPNTQQIFLEQNYRSTAAILRSCLAIYFQDKSRIPKSLHTSHPLGATPVLSASSSEKEEADFIASEIKRCVANMGGVLRWGDFVILLRFNALSRPIESALQKVGIPCRILGGHKFFERMEVKDILSYLQLADNPNFNPAFVRAVKVPSRGTGDKTLAEIASQAEKLKISQLELVERIHDNKIPDIKPSIKRKTASFVKTIRILRKLDEENTTPSEMIRKLVALLNYEDHLRKTQQDWESRWENVKELITFASEVETEVQAKSTESAPVLPGDQPQADGRPAEHRSSVLRQFLQASMLSSEGDNKSEEESKDKVTLSTCHAAKGLEWPVVMIPSVDTDTFPFYRTEDVEEERRLLYVACTRAQSLLYILHSIKRQVAGRTKDKKLSDFVSVVRTKNEGFFSYDVPRFLPQDCAVISKVLGRPLPDEAEVKRRLAEL